MASFQAKIGLKRMRKRENKNYCSVLIRHVIENSKKIQKTIKYYYGFISSQNKGKNAEKERK